MSGGELKTLGAEERRVVAEWLEQNLPNLPEPVRSFFALHQSYLSADGDLRRRLDVTLRELRRALGITPSSERRPSGFPRAGFPRKARVAPKTQREKLEAELKRTQRLSDWHKDLDQRHRDKCQRLAQKLAGMPAEPNVEDPITEDTPLEEIEISEENKAKIKAGVAQFVEHVLEGDGADPALASVNETLMPGGVSLPISSTRTSP